MNELEKSATKEYKQALRQIKRNQFWAKVKNTGENALDWVTSHQEGIGIALGGLMVVAGLVRPMIVTIRRNANMAQAKAEAQSKRLRVYDRSMNHWWYLRRELTNEEWSKVNEQKASGERLGDILQKMKVLK